MGLSLVGLVGSFGPLVLVGPVVLGANGLLVRWSLWSFWSLLPACLPACLVGGAVPCSMYSCIHLDFLESTVSSCLPDNLHASLKRGPMFGWILVVVFEASMSELFHACRAQPNATDKSQT